MNVETFLQADRLRHDAFIAGDTDVLNRLMADECLYIHTAGNIDRKDELINKIANRALNYHAIDNSVDHAILYENNTAVIAGRLRMNLRDRASPLRSI
ncbi:nuclear transport factor 2 family protein [Ochrobactrum grignonense]|nr:nuclear transport factor 2 family protein [Brucella grignonensis]